MITETNPASTLNPEPVAAIERHIDSGIIAERAREVSHFELIASENFTFPSIMVALGSVLTIKYAEGYPGKRYYGGCEHVDVVETIAIERAKELFGADHANVQPHAGSQANAAVYLSVLEPGDKILTMNLSDGGHLTHGHPMNFSGKHFEVVHYGVGVEDGLIDYDGIAETARTEKPKMITVGASAYSRVIDFERMGQIAREVGAYLMADIAHIAGLIAAGIHPPPCRTPTLSPPPPIRPTRPTGGLILAREHQKKIDSAVFPGTQGGPLMHVIAAKAICFEARHECKFEGLPSSSRSQCQGTRSRP